MKILAVFSSLFLASSLSFADAPINVDPEIVGALIVINQNEIAAAELALSKSTDKKVTDLAQMLKEEHSKNLEATMQLSKKQDIAPLNDQKVDELKTLGQQEASDLNKLSTSDFDKSYINDMVKDHESALAIIDGYLKEVTNPDLKKLLVDTQAHVQHHLDAAKQIQAQMS